MKAHLRVIGIFALLLVLLASPGTVTRAGRPASLAAPGTVYLPLISRNGLPSLDPTFGNNGLVITGLGSQALAYAMALQPDGKIVVGGTGETASVPGSSVVLVRFNPDGALDTHFGTGGAAIAGSPGDRANAVAIQSDGRIVEAGGASGFKSTFWQIGLFTANGILDPSFADNGELYDPFSLAAVALVVQPDGKIVASSGLVVKRYLANGTPDLSFGDHGQVPFAPGPIPSTTQVRALALEADGKLLAAGTTNVCPLSSCKFTLTFARYNADGSFDAGFGQNGIAYAAVDYNAKLSALVIQPDGKILSASALNAVYPNLNLAFVRLLANGAPDPSFGTDGVALSDWPTDAYDIPDPPFRMALQPDGRMVLAASVGKALLRQDCGGFQVRWYNSNGARDLKLGFGGVITTDAPYCDQVGGVAVQPDGKIVVAATHYDLSSAKYSILLARYEVQ